LSSCAIAYSFRSSKIPWTICNSRSEMRRDLAIAFHPSYVRIDRPGGPAGFGLTGFSITLPFVLIVRVKRDLGSAESANRRMFDHQYCVQFSNIINNFSSGSYLKAQIDSSSPTKQTFRLRLLRSLVALASLGQRRSRLHLKADQHGCVVGRSTCCPFIGICSHALPFDKLYEAANFLHDEVPTSKNQSFTGHDVVDEFSPALVDTGETAQSYLESPFYWCRGAGWSQPGYKAVPGRLGRYS
jgi:hypothetical protein